jgi:hypothetical protein
MFKQDLINAVNSLERYGVDQDGKCRYAAGCVIGQLIPNAAEKLRADSASASRVVYSIYQDATVQELKVADLVQSCHDTAFALRKPLDEFKEEARSIIDDHL